MSHETVDEESPLLPSPLVKCTPIPWFQISIVAFISLAEPLTSQVISPFAPQLIRDLGITHGNETRVGYYVGLLQSLFYVTEATTVLHWSKTSDNVGRKPMILLGIFGLSLSMYCFGLSKKFWGLVLSRCLTGALNGNVAVIKSMMAELSDPTNISRIYSIVPITWATGGMLGSAIGGSLSHPVQRFPRVFGDNEFLLEYPYFLPCAIVATYSAIAWLIAFVFLKETLKNPTPISAYFGITPHRGGSSLESPTSGSGSRPRSEHESDNPVPMRALFTRRIMVVIGNYVTTALLDILYRVIQPLFFSTPIALGGLGLPPPAIGYILAVFSILSGAFVLFLFPRIHCAWGSKKSFLVGVACILPSFACFPVMSWLGKQQGLSLTVWVVIVLQGTLFVGLNLSFGVAFIYRTVVSPNPASLGAINGLSQMMVSIIRAVGPAAVSSLFSLSIGNGYLGGYLVYYFLVLTVFGSLWVASLLPSDSEL